MSTPTRIYAVLALGAKHPRLVRASHPATALRHVAESAFSVDVASQDDIVNAMEAGAKVEDLRGEQLELGT